MGLFSTLNTGVTGLGVNSTSLAVAGDNLANLNTIGFKGSRAEFQDLIIQNVAGAGRSSQLGLGAFLGGVSSSFTQGSISTTGRTTDFAVDGSGFFVVESAEGQFYTRAGSLAVDDANRLTTLGGYALQGYAADENGELGSSLGDLTIGPNSLDPSATTEIALEANLDCAIEADPAGLWNGTLPTDPSDANDQCDASTSVTVYDSLGKPHDVLVYFQKTSDADNTWDYYVAVDAGEVGGTDGELELIEYGSLDFDTEGELEVSPSPTQQGTFDFVGATSQTIDLAFGDPNDDTVAGGLKARAGDDPEIANAINVTDLGQDGYGMGDLIDWQMDSDGVITGVYSNGETQTVGQVALATFTSTDGLTRAGDNLWLATSNSGQPLIGAAESGSRGSVYQYALEGSNVDIESEFVSMITAQRGYQAAARVVSSADQLLQELVNIV